MPDELRFGSLDIRPVGKTFPPKGIIFRDRMKLRHVERYKLNRCVAEWLPVVFRNVFRS